MRRVIHTPLSVHMLITAWSSERLAIGDSGLGCPGQHGAGSRGGNSEDKRWEDKRWEDKRWEDKRWALTRPTSSNDHGVG